MPCITQKLAFIYSKNRQDNAVCAHTVFLVTVDRRPSTYGSTSVSDAARQRERRDNGGIGREKEPRRSSAAQRPGCPGIRVNYSPIRALHCERRGIKLQDTYNAFNGPGPLTISRKPGLQRLTWAPRTTATATAPWNTEDSKRFRAAFRFGFVVSSLASSSKLANICQPSVALSRLASILFFSFVFFTIGFSTVLYIVRYMPYHVA